MAVQFFICKHCGNLVGMVHNAGVPMMCCGAKMEELKPNTTDAAQEKHVPVVSVSGNVVRVEVGSVAHPMTEEHLIEWICLETDRGAQRKSLAAGGAPVVEFALQDEKPIAVYAYCNLHGLWKADV